MANAREEQTSVDAAQSVPNQALRAVNADLLDEARRTTASSRLDAFVEYRVVTLREGDGDG